MEDQELLTWHDAADLNALAATEGLSVVLGDTRIALFKLEKSVYAIEDQCPHQGALLSEGGAYNDGDGPIVVCPIHWWTFSLLNGVSPSDPDYQALTFRTRIEGDRVFVGVPQRLPSAS